MPIFAHGFLKNSGERSNDVYRAYTSTDLSNLNEEDIVALDLPAET
jgi:hypothetical protein